MSAGEPQPKAERTQRRQRRAPGGRIARHVVRVTPEQEAQLLALALRYRVSVPKLLVDSALAGGSAAAASNASVRVAIIDELFGVHRLLASISANVNQMAKATNATGEVQDSMEATSAHVRAVADRIDAYIDKLSRAAS